MGPILYVVQPVFLLAFRIPLPSKVPCRIVFEIVLRRVALSNVVREGSYFPAREPSCCLINVLVL